MMRFSGLGLWVWYLDFESEFVVIVYVGVVPRITSVVHVIYVCSFGFGFWQRSFQCGIIVRRLRYPLG